MASNVSSAPWDSCKIASIDDVGLIRTLVAVVECGSFSEAGRRLRVVPSTISKQLSRLEERVNCQLIVRSTKKLYVTELGKIFYDRALAIMDSVEKADAQASDFDAEAAGVLRITAATALATKHLLPVFDAFAHKHPKIRLDVLLSSEVLDLGAEGLDAGIRITAAPDPSLHNIRLASNQRIICASPQYLRKHGQLISPVELQAHNCLLSKGPDSAWPILQSDGSISVLAVSGNLRTDSADILRNALVDGIGVGFIARYLVYDDLMKGRLVELFPSQRVIDTHIFAVYPRRPSTSLRTRVFIDHLQDTFRVCPPWAQSEAHWEPANDCLDGNENQRTRNAPI